MKVAIIGASGFIGGAVRRNAPAGSRVTLVTRTPIHSHHNEVWRPATLDDPELLTAALQGAEVVFHCVSYVGSDYDLCTFVNDAGTRNISQAFQNSGARLLIYVSTSGVYGRGPHRGAKESTPLMPLSAVSASRMIAEQHIVAANGIVMRPHLLYGVADRWVVPQLRILAHTQDARLRTSRALTSILSVDELAAQLWALATQSVHKGPKIYNADHGDPQSITAIAELCANLLPEPLLTERPNASELTGHQVTMLTEDSWFSSALPGKLTYPAPRPFTLSPEMVRWYSGQA